LGGADQISGKRSEGTLSVRSFIDRIQYDASADFEKMAVFLDQYRFASPLEQMAGPSVPFLY
jgi:hypothetical protein